MHYSPISAAVESSTLDLFNLLPSFQGARSNAGKDKPRNADLGEVEAYMTWVAMRAGVAQAVTEKPKLKWTEPKRGVERRCLGAGFGGVFVPMPGADQTGAVDCEILDETGNVECAFTIRPKGGRGGKLECAKADEAALKAANKGKAKRAPKAAPVADTAPPAPPLEEIESQSAPVAPLVTWQDCARELRADGYNHTDSNRYAKLPEKGKKWTWAYIHKDDFGGHFILRQGQEWPIPVASPAIEASTIYAAPIGPELPAQAPVGIETVAAPECEQETPFDALSARMAEIEARLAAIETDTPQSGELAPSLGECVARVNAPLSPPAPVSNKGAHDDRPRRLRIVRAYLKMRKQRVAMRADYVEEHDRAIKIAQERNKAVESCQEAWKEMIAMEAQRDHARQHLQQAILDKAALESENANLVKARARILPAAIKHRATARTLALDLASARNMIEIRTAKLVELERNLADPMMPERQSDIARLVQERDAARNERDNALAKAARVEMAADSLGDQIDAMAARMIRAEQALKRAGITPLAAVA